MSTSTLNLPGSYRSSSRTVWDWTYAALVIALTGWAVWRYGSALDGYELGVLLCAAPAMIAMGWFWSPWRVLTLGVGVVAWAAIALYQRKWDSHGVDLAAADHVFWLKYLLSSQSAILWMCVLLFMSTLFYWSAIIFRKQTPQTIATGLAWAGAFMGMLGSMVRWFESHQIAPDIGHIPVSNLYEVFVLFIWMTTLFWLYFESSYRKNEQSLGGLGAFVMLVVSAAQAFLLWYAIVRGASEIQPLVPALQSWWMKIHVPANFVGYGMFALSAMVALAYLLKSASSRALWLGLIAVPVITMALPMAAYAVLGAPDAAMQVGLLKAARMLGGLLAFFGVVIAARTWINGFTPSLVLADDLMYKAIGTGFAFFTIATILGAFWAAEAWGGYWSWDPKETWALIVWLNYAIWLHMRLMKGLRGEFAAWWALVGLLVTTFAFLGVNMFLSGLHSYGEL